MWHLNVSSWGILSSLIRLFWLFSDIKGVQYQTGTRCKTISSTARLAARAEEKSSPSCIDFPVSGPILKKVNFLLGKFEFYAKVNFDVFYNSNKFIIYQYLRRCGGLVVRVHTSRLPVPGSILGPGPPFSVV